jgi:hypothetical protein
VVDAGTAQDLVGVLRDQAALAGDERGCDRTGLPADGISDPAGQRVAGPVDRRDHREIERRRGGGRAQLDLAGERADGADAVEVGVAREVVAARPRRLRQRQQARPAGDEIAGSDALQVAQGRAHAGRPALGGKPRELARPDDDAASPDALLDDLDEA